MKTIIRVVALLALGLSMQACASVTTGTSQAVAVDTTPVQQATCVLQNEKGQWTIVRTPGTATVSKAYGPLSVQCKTEAGHAGTSSVTSTTAGAAFGNIIAGGLIGAAVDMGSGAAYQYPAQVVVAMAPPATPIPSPATAVPVVQAPMPVLCRIGKIEEYRTEDWCSQAGGKAIRVGPPQPVAMGAPSLAGASANTTPPLKVAAPAPGASTQATTTSAVSPTASSLCYLPDGSKAPLDQAACAAQKGFIGA